MRLFANLECIKVPKLLDHCMDQIYFLRRKDIKVRLTKSDWLLLGVSEILNFFIGQFIAPLHFFDRGKQSSWSGTFWELEVFLSRDSLPKCQVSREIGIKKQLIQLY